MGPQGSNSSSADAEKRLTVTTFRRAEPNCDSRAGADPRRTRVDPGERIPSHSSVHGATAGKGAIAIRDTPSTRLEFERVHFHAAQRPAREAVRKREIDRRSGAGDMDPVEPSRIERSTRTLSKRQRPLHAPAGRSDRLPAPSVVSCTPLWER